MITSLRSADISADVGTSRLQHQDQMHISDIDLLYRYTQGLVKHSFLILGSISKFVYGE
jgi:hypothetical protein